MYPSNGFFSVTILRMSTYFTKVTFAVIIKQKQLKVNPDNNTRRYLLWKKYANF